MGRGEGRGVKEREIGNRERRGEQGEVAPRQIAIVGIINLTCYFRRLVTVRECCVISGHSDGLTGAGGGTK